MDLVHAATSATAASSTETPTNLHSLATYMTAIKDWAKGEPEKREKAVKILKDYKNDAVKMSDCKYTTCICGCKEATQLREVIASRGLTKKQMGELLDWEVIARDDIDTIATMGEHMGCEGRCYPLDLFWLIKQMDKDAVGKWHDKYGQTLAHALAHGYSYEQELMFPFIFDYLVSECGVDPNLKLGFEGKGDEMTPYSTCYHPPTEDDYGRTFLDHAILRKNPVLTGTLLFRYGCDPQIKTKRESTRMYGGISARSRAIADCPSHLKSAMLEIRSSSVITNQTMLHLVWFGMSYWEYYFDGMTKVIEAFDDPCVSQYTGDSYVGLSSLGLEGEFKTIHQVNEFIVKIKESSETVFVEAREDKEKMIRLIMVFAEDLYQFTKPLVFDAVSCQRKLTTLSKETRSSIYPECETIIKSARAVIALIEELEKIVKPYMEDRDLQFIDTTHISDMGDAQIGRNGKASDWWNLWFVTNYLYRAGFLDDTRDSEGNLIKDLIADTRICPKQLGVDSGKTTVAEQLNEWMTEEWRRPEGAVEAEQAALSALD